MKKALRPYNWRNNHTNAMHAWLDVNMYILLVLILELSSSSSYTNFPSVVWIMKSMCAMFKSIVTRFQICLQCVLVTMSIIEFHQKFSLKYVLLFEFPLLKSFFSSCHFKE